jgi:hypothetical protein
LKVPQRNRIYNTYLPIATRPYLKVPTQSHPLTQKPKHPQTSSKMDAKTEVMQQVRQQAAIANARALVEVCQFIPILTTIPIS